LEFKEVKPKIKLSKNIEKECLVSIAIHGTAQTKYWNNPTGWQELVDYIKSKGYRVALISKEEDGYMGNKHPKGVEYLFNNDIETVIDTLQKSVLFIGISSGLSWLSWAVGTNTCLISGFTDPKTEFEDCVRISPEEHICQGCFKVKDNAYKIDNTPLMWAIANAKNPIMMAKAMKLGVEAGRLAFLAGRMAKKNFASPSSPTEGKIASINK
jgi:autotransporter strand-loop-strand O-heptosyltransferase